MSYVTSETATVYRASNGRRFLSKRAAYRKAAHDALKTLSGCWECDSRDPCGFHGAVDYRHLVQFWASALESHDIAERYQ